MTPCKPWLTTVVPFSVAETEPAVVMVLGRRIWVGAANALVVKAHNAAPQIKFMRKREPDDMRSAPYVLKTRMPEEASEMPPLLIGAS